MENTRIILKSGKDQSLRRYHPWVFSGAIKKIKGKEPAEGDVVYVYDNKDEFLGLGHYQKSTIAVRIISFEEVDVNADFWRQKIMKAYGLRSILGLIDNPLTNVFRLINAEGDGLPGLIIDYYNGVAVLQAHSVGMYKNLETICQVLQEIFGDRLHAIYNKSSSTLPYKADVTSEDSYLFGDPSEEIISENGLKFHVNWEKGQKTGFYVDQRENRLMLKKFAKDKKVLNLFGYTGGFSVYAMDGGCRSVDTVDSSQRAVELANLNASLNFGEENNHKGIASDAFQFLKEMDNDYDLIILDPPAFAKHNRVLHNALQGYKKLNRSAIEKIKKGGVLLTFSCSQVVSNENFRKMVFTASANVGRNVRILYQLNQPADHPISVYHPEGEYLKGLVVQVD